MVRAKTSNGALQDDLVQEALVHLWRTERRRPGQTRSWYLQSCRFHVQHCLASGRSVDSVKRWVGRLEVEAVEGGQEMEVPAAGPECCVVNQVGARDLVAMLTARLGASEGAVLAWLMEGLSTREIGRRLGISHTMVVKHRRRIATLLRRLEGDDTGFLGGGGNGKENPTDAWKGKWLQRRTERSRWGQAEEQFGSELAGKEHAS